MFLLRFRRWRNKKNRAGTALQRCWDCELPSLSSDWRKLSFLVCDGEMSSLDEREGELLSVGWVVVECGAIALGSARHYLLKVENTVGQSASIHQLRDCELEDGKSAEEVLDLFLAAAAGRVLVFHNAALDTAFLNQQTRRLYGAPLLLPTVDTLLLEQAKLRRADAFIQGEDLRLYACRSRYNLPGYPVHNALVDALATAELFIAQAVHRGGGGLLPLRKLL